MLYSKVTQICIIAILCNWASISLLSQTDWKVWIVQRRCLLCNFETIVCISTNRCQSLLHILQPLQSGFKGAAWNFLIFHYLSVFCGKICVKVSFSVEILNKNGHCLYYWKDVIMWYKQKSYIQEYILYYIGNTVNINGYGKRIYMVNGYFISIDYKVAEQH